MIEGVAVEKMVRKVDYELILGMKKDGQFGSVIVFGSGGVAAEGLADFAIGLPPLNQTLARRMMEETQVYRRIQDAPEARGPTRRSSLKELLTILSNIVVDFPEIAQITINPRRHIRGAGVRGRRAHHPRHGRLGGQALPPPPGDHSLSHALRRAVATHRRHGGHASADPARRRAAGFTSCLPPSRMRLFTAGS